MESSHEPPKAKMTPSQILEAAKALIDRPEKWCRNDYARNKDGVRVNWDSEQACVFCAMGAIHRVTLLDSGIPLSLWSPIELRTRRYNLDPAVKYAIGEGSRAVSGTACITDTNDFGGYEKTLAMFDKAIQIAKEREDNGNPDDSGQSEAESSPD